MDEPTALLHEEENSGVMSASFLDQTVLERRLRDAEPEVRLL